MKLTEQIKDKDQQIADLQRAAKDKSSTTKANREGGPKQRKAVYKDASTEMQGSDLESTAIADQALKTENERLMTELQEVKQEKADAEKAAKKLQKRFEHVRKSLSESAGEEAD